MVTGIGKTRLGPDAVDVREAARRLGLSPATVWRRVSDGTLPSLKIGGARRIPLSAVLPPKR